jgi:hypothetical protein
MKYLVLCTALGLGVLTGCESETDPRPETPTVDPTPDVEPSTPDVTVIDPPDVTIVDPATPGTSPAPSTTTTPDTTPTPQFPTEGNLDPGAIEAPDVEEEPAGSLPQN